MRRMPHACAQGTSAVIWRNGDAPMMFIRSALAIALLISAQPGIAQTWQSGKPITMVVPFPPGPALDLVARAVAGKVGPALGATIVVENRVGANGTIGANAVARAAPDGYTILAGTAGPL